MEWLVIALLAALMKGGKKMADVVKPSLSRKEFAQKFLEAAKSVDWRGIPVRFAMAQSDVESGAGTSALCKEGNNLFGLQVGSGWRGAWNGDVFTFKSGARFRKYNSWSDSMKDWVQLMHFPLYRNALNYAVAGNLTGWAAEMKRVGYDASTPTYAKVIEERYRALEGVA